jgi:hypothetical protein
MAIGRDGNRRSGRIKRESVRIACPAVGHSGRLAIGTEDEIASLTLIGGGHGASFDSVYIAKSAEA